MEYKKIKTALQSKRNNIRGFSKKWFMQFLHDIKNGIPGSETSKSYFYISNGGAYCEFLEIYHDFCN